MKNLMTRMLAIPIAAFALAACSVAHKETSVFVDPQFAALVPPDTTLLVGTRVEHLSEDRRRALFEELESFGVRHDDPDVRNVTYRAKDGRFCVIDFEFAKILPGFE